MNISPYIDNQELTASSVSVRVNPEDRQRAESLVARTREIVIVNSHDTFAQARHAAGQLKGMIEEIEDARKACQRPFKAINEAISNQAHIVGDAVAQEHRRILDMLNGHVARLAAEAKAEEQRRAEERRRQESEHQRKVEEALEARRQAEERARLAQNEAERQKARADSNAALARAAQEQLARELASEIADIGNQAPRGLVPDGRVNHTWEFRLVNVRETIKSGSLSLLRFELDKLACLDSIKSQLSIDPQTEPSLPGIEVTRKINVSVRASAA